jgi:arginyl-tRNA synthetase
MEGLLEECEDVLASHEASDRCVSIEPRRREDQAADLRLLFADRKWLQSPAGEQLRTALARHPAIANAQRHRSAVLVRFDDVALAKLERRLAAGENTGMSTSDLLVGDRFMVSFVGANTNKALHVGHLRNIVLGQALASALSAAGATVQRHSLVGDIGRRVCEAMAGYVAHHAGETPETAGLAGDRFVELCYRDWSRGQAPAGEAAQAGDPNAEENEVRGDAADAIMAAWLAGAPSERALWRQMRDWVLASHRRTLARVGVVIDRHDFESDEIGRARAVIARGLDDGLFEREATGGVIYRTGRSEYTTMVLLRTDGAPTEYARLLGLYDRILEDLGPDGRFVEVVGIEWRPAALALGDLLAWPRRGADDDRCRFVFHGSVTDGVRKMGSSTGDVTWVDGLLDTLAASGLVARLQDLAGGVSGKAEIADTMMRGTLLCAPPAQPLAFAVDRVVEGRSGAGLTIAQAWCRAQRPARSSRDAPVARTAVVQSQLYRRSLRRAVDNRDVSTLASYALGLCEACLSAPAPGPAASAILLHALSGLGFVVQRHGQAILATDYGRAIEV